ncbi:MAG: amidohydrolase [Acidimicrobiales bacterium]
MRIDAVYRGRIATWDPTRPVARAVAVHGGRVVAFDDDADSLAGDAGEREDFGAAWIFPGFHDAHCHTTASGFALDQVDLSTPPVRSLDDLYAAVAERAAATAPGGWVIGGGYDQNKLGGRHPSRQRLDAVAGGRPVWLQHTSGHMGVLNSAALALVGAAVDAPVEGGRVQRDDAGEPTGLLEERAQALVQRLVLPRSSEAIAAAIGRAHDRYLAEGITSVCDAGVAGGWIGQSPVELAGYQLARDTGRLRVRTTAMLSSDALVPVTGHTDDGAPGVQALGVPGGLRSGLGDEWLRLGPVKVFSDGSLIGRTCWMEHGFADDPANTGYPQADPDRLRAVILGAHAAGWQVATHAIGDAAVAFVLDCYEEALSRLPRADHRHRIEHCGVTTPSSLARLAALGVVAVPQGRFVGEIGDGMRRAVGEDRVADTYRLRSFLDAGVILPGSSDRPVVDGRPLLGIRDMVRRRTESGASFAPGEALTAEQAMRAYSVGSAAAEHTDVDRGSLRVGQLADFVVLAEDPRAASADDIADVPVVATAVGGRLAYLADDTSR